METNNADTLESSRKTYMEENDSCESTESELEGDEIYPNLEPVYDGEEIKIENKLVENGLSVISLRRVPQGLKFSQGKIQERNTFYDIHRPELKKLNWVRKIPDECRKETIEKMFLEVTTENVKLNDSLTVLHHRPSSMKEYNSQSSIGSLNIAMEESKKDASNVDKSNLLLLMAPVQMQDHSDENLIWSMNDMREACALDSQEEKRMGRDTGGGEEGECEDKTKLCHTACGSSACSKCLLMKNQRSL